MIFKPVNKCDCKFLYKMLKERPEVCWISHKKMPTYKEHCAFVNSSPYPYWFIITEDGVSVGNIYLTNKNEIGIFILKKYQRKGYGSRAIELLTREIRPLYANIAPGNIRSRKMFEKLGFNLVQNTLRRG